MEAKYAGGGFGYVGAENYPAGHALGVQAVKVFNLKKGDRAMVWGCSHNPLVVCAPKALLTL